MAFIFKVDEQAKKKTAYSRQQVHFEDRVAYALWQKTGLVLLPGHFSHVL
jgi:hypothetical protein